MNSFTDLERQVMTEILSSLIYDARSVAEIIDTLTIAERRLSIDVTDKSKCTGFYLDFEKNECLRSIEDIPHHIGLQATNSATPAGGDFILFFDQESKGIDYLEASFFDHSLLTGIVTSDNHGFVIVRR